MKKIQVRKPGTVKLTSIARPMYGTAACIR